MATGTERSKALHNFTMPCNLRWGNQRFLRCMKVNSGGQTSDSSDQRRTNRNGGDGGEKRDNDCRDEFLAGGSHKVGPTAPPPGDDDGIAAMREKVMLDLQTAADKMKHAIFKDGEVCGSSPAEGEANRPWNLRTRRAPAVSGFVSGNNGGGGKVDVPRPSSGAAVAHKSPIHGGAAAASGEKRERVKFSVPISKREMEEDFLAMVGHRPPRRPKKRARFVQKQLDTLFPGLWLTEVTPDMYKVVEAAP